MVFFRPVLDRFLLSSLLLSLLFSPAAAQTVRYVDASATGAANGTSWTDAFTDLQEALAVASPADEIWVAAGLYLPGVPGNVDATFAVPGGVALYGGFAGTETSREQRDPTLNETRLSGDLGEDDIYAGPAWNQGWDDVTPNARHVLTVDDPTGLVTIDGVTIERGRATGNVGYDGVGSGLLVRRGDVLLRGCLFTLHASANIGGAGVYTSGGRLTVERCTFLHNRSRLAKGAGIYAAAGVVLEVRDSEFRENETVGSSFAWAAGGGIFADSGGRVEILRTLFLFNTATNLHAMGDQDAARGAGIYSTAHSLSVRDSEFRGNWAHEGGGIYHRGDRLRVENSLFFDNTVVAYQIDPVVSRGGAGAGLLSSSSLDHPAQVVASVFAGNHAGEAAGITGIGPADLFVRGSILWGNTATGGGVSTRGRQIKGLFASEYSCIEGLLEQIPGEDPPDPANFPGSIDQDPLFIDLAVGDLHLGAGSPCIDAGENGFIGPLTGRDLDAAPRFTDDPATADSGAGLAPIVDMGPFEFGAAGRVTEFVALPRSGPAPLQARFWDQSTGADDTWSWDLGDGATSTQQHPAHNYVNAGPYDVTLSVDGLDGPASRTRLGYIDVLPRPPAPGGISDLRLVRYLPFAREIEIAFTPACDATDHALYSGPLSALPLYGWDDAACGLGVTGTTRTPTLPGDRFYVLVGQSTSTEGSYGRNFSGAERPEAKGLAACDLPQDLATACP